MATIQIHVSVIIPAYNYGRYLAECLDSMVAQTLPNWECIIIDNGSTDDTATIAAAYVQKDKRFSYHYTDQRGVSAARNKGVRLCSGRYILPLDADDKIAATYLEKAVEVMELNPDIKVTYCDAMLFGALSGKWILPPYSLKGLLTENSIFCSALFRKTDFTGFNENMKEGFEDWDFWINMLQDGGKVYKIPEVLFYYRMRPDSRNGVLQKEKQLKLRQQIFENHRALYERFFTIPELIFEIYNLNHALISFKKSKEVKYGSYLLRPLRFFKKLIMPGKK